MAHDLCATVKAVRHLFDDCFHVGILEATSAGFRAFTARGLRLGSFDTAVYVAGRRPAHLEPTIRSGLQSALTRG